MIYTQNYLKEENISTTLMGHHVFIDSGVDDIKTLVEHSRVDTNTVLLDPQKDGILQISEYLRTCTDDIRAIHVIAHASPGRLALGNSHLDINTLTQYQDKLRSWAGKTSNRSGDFSSPMLYLYGCNLARGEDGYQFLLALQQTIKMPVLASTTTVGHKDFGGDWTLDILCSDEGVISYWPNTDSLNGKSRGVAFNAPVFPFENILPEKYHGAFPEAEKLVANDGGRSDQLGINVDISGNRLIMGAKGEDENAGNSGAAYVYEFTGGRWVQTKKLKASDASAGDFLGRTVAIDGSTAIAGAFTADADQGAVYVYNLNSASRTEVVKLTASDGEANERFGRSLDINGNQIIVGAYYDNQNGGRSGSAYIYNLNTSTGRWEETAKLTASDGRSSDRFGTAVAIEGNTAIVGARNDDDGQKESGSLYVFNKGNNGNWSQVQKLTASDPAHGALLGEERVAIDGNFIIAGAPGDDDNGNDSGSAYIFSFNGTRWVETAKLTANDGAPGDYFGFSVDIEGNIAVVGSRNANGKGAVYAFERSGNNWNQISKYTASDGASGDLLGWSVSVEGDVVLGSAKNDNTSQGAGYIFDLNNSGGGSPPQRGKITIVKSTDIEDGTNFNFNGDLGTFTLDDANPDDGDSVNNSRVFNNLNAGRYTIRELVTSGFALNDIRISGDTDSDSSINVSNREATINLDGGEDIVVTFESSPSGPAPLGSITVMVSNNVKDGTNVDFSGDLGSFTLDDASPDDGDGVSNTAIFTNLTSGSYRLAELPFGNFNLANITITGDSDSGSSSNVSNREATLDLDNGEDLVVTFNNVQQSSGGGTTEIDGTSGDDTLIGTEDNNIIDAKGGNDLLQGLGGDDTLWGGSRNDTLEGGDGNDDLSGGSGRDILIGGAGDDILNPNKGSGDQLTGEAGADTFTFSDRAGTQTILDFELGTDQLNVSALTTFTTLDTNSDGMISAADTFGSTVGGNLQMNLTSFNGGRILLSNVTSLSVSDFAS